MAGNTSTSLLLAFLMAAVSVQAYEWRSLIQHKSHVVLVNDLPGGAPLSFKCHSKEADLGRYTIGKGQTKEIGFYAYVWGDPLVITCDFSWGRTEHHSYDIYDQDKDVIRCMDSCRLHIEPQGPFFYAEVITQKYVHSYKSIWLKVPRSWK